jgi:CRISPR type IV-associated protein Csf1
MEILISKHLNRQNLKLKIYQVSSICAFTGVKITEGVLMKDLIKPTFTDQELIKFNSEYASIDIALLIEEVIKGEKGFNSMRNYSFYADESKLKLLKRENILELLLNIPNKPFQIGVTFSNKKHLAYKSPVNFDTDNYQVMTDLGIVNFEREKAIEIIGIAQKWYSVLPDKKETAALPTYFTKEQIKGLSNPNHKQIQAYGLQKYFKESQELDKFRNTSLFNLIIHCLNKKV